MLFTKRQALILHLLQKTKPRERSALLAGVEDDIIKVMTECIHNTLRGNVPLTSAQWKQLRKYKQILRSLSNRSVSLQEKRHLLVSRQRGGFLPILLPILVSAVGALLNNNN
jgi:hypothetical protein